MKLKGESEGIRSTLHFVNFLACLQQMWIKLARNLFPMCFCLSLQHELWEHDKTISLSIVLIIYIMKWSNLLRPVDSWLLRFLIVQVWCSQDDVNGLAVEKLAPINLIKLLQ